MATKKILIVIDVQNDFITGALRNEEAIKKLPNIVKFLNEEPFDRVVVTMDTHEKDYLSTLEGQKLPVEHCIQGTEGWLMPKEIGEALERKVVVQTFHKPTFGSSYMANYLAATLSDPKDEYEFTIVGFCTDICVVNNALLLRANFPNSKITVLRDCVAGTTPENGEAALTTMRMCQIEVK